MTIDVIIQPPHKHTKQCKAIYSIWGYMIVCNNRYKTSSIKLPSKMFRIFDFNNSIVCLIKYQWLQICTFGMLMECSISWWHFLNTDFCFLFSHLGYTNVCNQPQPSTTIHHHPQPPKNYPKKSQLVTNSHVTALRC